MLIAPARCRQNRLPPPCADAAGLGAREIPQHVYPARHAALPDAGDTSLPAKPGSLVPIEPAKQSAIPGRSRKLDERTPDRPLAGCARHQAGVPAKVVQSSPNRGGSNGARVSQAPSNGGGGEPWLQRAIGEQVSRAGWGQRRILQTRITLGLRVGPV
jgi:hypothetical protein